MSRDEVKQRQAEGRKEWARRLLAGRVQRGPKPIPVHKQAWYELGQSIQQLVENGLSPENARKKMQGRYQYSTVKRAHVRYLRYLRAEEGRR